MARRKSSNTSGSQPLSMTDAAVMLAEYAAGVLAQPESRSHSADLKLSPSERAILIGLPGLNTTLRERLTITSRGVKSFDFALDDLARICLALSEALIETRGRDAVRLLSIAGKVTDRLDHAVSELAKASKPKEPGLTPTGSNLTTAVYQFKITLKDTKPPIWRRIQVKDCTIDKLHEHIQTAMGWTNSHLHHFKIDGRR